ncbi:hypothetical protein [Flavobacterium tegetincola]|uniref:hypothetical protein n=1 Tax=Flavobacterium tegetincola TaxID=150172 RepID=UPI0004024C04|nr:hypothetical protein [Flavobacterium tegetincola]
MTIRETFIKELRGDAFGKVAAETSSEEFFQNETLRPIMKLQNDLLLAVFQNYITKSKVNFAQLSIENKFIFIDNAIKKDIKFQSALKGLVIGFFTLEEYNRYATNSSALTKRISNLLIERIKSQVQLLDKS